MYFADYDREDSSRVSGEENVNTTRLDRGRDPHRHNLQNSCNFDELSCESISQKRVESEIAVSVKFQST